MELYEMIFGRLKDDESIREMTASFDSRAAVFHERAPSSDNEKWDDPIQYPRIDYTIDMQENPARHTSGILMINVWCDTQVGADPQEIEIRIRELLHAAFAQTDDYIYCFAWQRSDPFEVKTKQDETVRTIGVTIVFDLVACPCQYTMTPDPIKGLNEWTKTILPEAVVIGKDEVEGWLMPTRGKPVVYWRLTGQGKAREYHTHAWLDITVEGHVYCRSAADRLYNLVQLNTAHALTGHIPLEDGSPLMLKTFTVNPHMNYIATGQIRATGYFGILQPLSHFSNKGTGYKLCRTNIPREIIDMDTQAIEVSADQSRPYPFQYPQSSEHAQTGRHPQQNTVGAFSDGEIPVAEQDRGYVKTYDAANIHKYPKS